MGIVVSIISSFASNLWNHSNDVNEDIAQGKKTVLTQNYVSYKTTVVLSIALYIISIISVLYLSILLIKPIYYFFLPWSIITWWYSDNIFLRKIFGFRLKTHYFGEIITYGIACPSYTLSIWLIYSDLNYQGIAVALAFLGGIFYLGGMKEMTGFFVAALALNFLSGGAGTLFVDILGNLVAGILGGAAAAAGAGAAGALLMVIWGWLMPKS